jgi:acyl-CoA thioester hydrolase
MDPSNLTAETDFIVEFYDVDSMEIAWHGSYIKYFEKARRVLLDKIGYSYKDMKTSGYAFPVTEISLKYIRPLRFGDRVKAKAILNEYENRLRIRYELVNTQTGLVTTKGQSTHMAYHIESADSCFECPRVLIDKVESLLAGCGAGDAG